MQLPASGIYPDSDESPAESVPIVTGSHGLTGRPRDAFHPMQIRPVPDPDEEEAAAPLPPGEGPSLPAPCLRLLHALTADPTCPGDCPGVQREGGCLCDIVRAAQRAGVAWSFELDHDGYWIYNGPELDG